MLKCAKLAVVLLLLAGCANPHKPAAMTEAELDRQLGREPRSVREQYLESHPDVDSVDREFVLSGSLSTTNAETHRLSRAQLDKELKDSEAALAAQRAAAAQARTNYAVRADIPQSIREATLERKILIGMTSDQVKLAWGEPDRITTSVSTLGTSESWTYAGGAGAANFQDGKLASFTTSH